MRTITIELDDCITVSACPGCEGRSTRRWSERESLLPRVEHCVGGVAHFSAEAFERRQLMVCDDCGLWFHSLIPNTACIQALNDAPAYVSKLAPSSARGSFRRGWTTLEARPSKPSSVLDVGASGGDFLRGCKGMYRAALEPSLHSQESLAFVDHLLCGVLDGAENPLPTDAFDAISLFDVAEHLASPLKGFRRLSEALKPNGTLIIETGDTDSPAAREGPLWYYTRYSSHFVFWNRRSLTALLTRSGFRLVEFRRVEHESPSRRDRALALARWPLYQAVTGFGRRRARWTQLAERLGRSGAAPLVSYTDHFYAVAEAVRPVSPNA